MWEPSCALLRSEAKLLCPNDFQQSHQKVMERWQGGASPPALCHNLLISVAISAPKEKNNFDVINTHISHITSGCLFLEKVPVALNIPEERCFYLLKWKVEAHVFSSTEHVVSLTSVWSTEGIAECSWGLEAGVAELGVITPTLSWQLGTGWRAQIKCSCLFSFWGSQVEQKQASQLEMDFYLGMFWELMIYKVKTICIQFKQDKRRTECLF